MTDTWFQRALPVLTAISEADAHGEDLDQAATTALPDLDPALYRSTVEALHEAGYIEARFNRGDGRLMSVRVVRLLERGRRTTRQWPSESLAEALLEIIDREIEHETDPQRRGRLEQLRDTARDLGVGMLGNILVALGQSGIQGIGG